ncbi:MAG: site-specific integrase [Magnetospirillum sp.]|nr:site-specific integrase [Magnetospirillum sp.]
MDRMHLTEATVKALDTDGRTQRIVWDEGTPGFGVKVGKRRKAFIVRYRPHGAKEREVTIGTWPGLSVRDARLKAAQTRSQAAAEGRDPLVERQQRRLELAPDAAFRAVMERYWLTDQHHLKLRQRKNEENLICNHVFPDWENRPVVEITSADALFVLEGIASKHPIQANRVLFALRKPFRWMVRHRLIPVSPVGDLERLSPENKRSRVLSDEEIRAIWSVATDQGVYGRLVKFLLLTGLRRDEARCLQWREVEGLEMDGSPPKLVIPPERMKNLRFHALPLNPLAAGILRECPALGDYVFAVSAKPYSTLSKANTRFDLACDVKDWTLHDLRRTVRTRLAALGISKPISERVLAHAQDKLDDIYDRHHYLDEKRDALSLWEAELRRIVGENVTPLRPSVTHAENAKTGAAGGP